MREIIIALLSLILVAFVLWGIIEKTRQEEGIVNKLKAIFGDLF